MNTILIFPDVTTRDAYIKVLKEIGAIVPTGKGNTSVALRAYYPEFSGRMIVNTSSYEMQIKLGRHRVTTPIEVDNPTEAGERAVHMLQELGFEATLNDHAEPELPKGFMCFVSVPSFDGIILLFWPKNPDPEAVAAFRASGEFGPWTNEDYGA